MPYYYTRIVNNNTIVYKKSYKYIDNTDNYVEIKSNNEYYYKLIKYKQIDADNYLSIDDVSYSVILDCQVNNINITKKTFALVLQFIYITIGNGSSIIKNTLLDIQTGITDNIDTYTNIPELSIHYKTDYHKKTLMREILQQCIKYNIKFKISLKKSINSNNTLNPIENQLENPLVNHQINNTSYIYLYFEVF